MKLNIFKEKLNQSLLIIESIIKKSTNLAILNNVLLETEKNFLKMSATNLETSVIWRILSKIEEEGKLLIPASFFKSVISFLKKEIIKLESEGGNLILKTENQEIKIQGENLDDFVIIPEIIMEDFIELNGNNLLQGLNQIINIPSISKIKPEISGIYFLFNKNKLEIAATDSFRLGCKIINLEEKVKKDFSFILSQSAIRDLINILSLKPIKLKLYYNPKQVLFEWLGEESSYSEIYFSSFLIEGEYPNYQDIIPKKYTTQIILDKEEVRNQLKTANLFTGKTSEVNFTILPKENKIKILSQSPEIGKNEVYLPIKIEEKTDKELEISFNCKFLIDGLNNFKSSEVKLNFNTKEDVMTMTPVGDESYLYILMPIKS